MWFEFERHKENHYYSKYKYNFKVQFLQYIPKCYYFIIIK